MLGLLEVMAVTGTLVAALTWLAVAAAAQAVARAASSRPGERALVALRAFVSAPGWMPVLVIGTALSPGVAGLVVAGLDHCAAHVSHHHHLCLVHPPHATRNAAVWVSALLAFSPTLVVVLGFARRLVRASHEANTLISLATPSAVHPDVRVLDRPEPIALSVGLTRPTVVLSRGLVEGVGPATLAVVLEHERAHIRHGDTRWAVLERAFLSLLPARSRDALLDALSLCREVARDTDTVAADGSPARVARALLEVARLADRPTEHAGSADLRTLRVRLQRLGRPVRSPRHGRVAVAALAGITLLGVGPVLHSGVERFFNVVFH